MADIIQTPPPEQTTEEQVNVFNPKGELVSLPQSQVKSAISPFGGYKIATPEDVHAFENDEKYGGLGQQAIAGVEGALNVPTVGLFTGVEKAFGAKDEDIQGRREAGYGHAIGQGLGLAGTAWIPGLGEAAAARIGLGAAEAGIASRIGAHAVKEAVTMMSAEAGDEVSKMITNDPARSVGTAAAHIALSGILGGVFGGVTGGVSELGRASLGKYSKLAEEFQARAVERQANPDPVASATEALSNIYEAVKKPSVLDFKGAKKEAISQVMPEMNQDIQSHMSKVVQELESKAGGDPTLTGAIEKFKAEISPEIDAATGAPTEPITSHEVYGAADKLKAQFQELSKYDATKSNPFRNTAKSMAHDLRVALEDESVWGKAGKIQSEANASVTELLKPLGRLEAKFTELNGVGERVISPSRVETYLKQNAGNKTAAVMKKDILDSVIEPIQKHIATMNRIREGAGMEPISISADQTVLDSLTADKLSPGAKIYDYLHEKGANNLLGEGLGTGVGAAIGAIAGHPAIGALLGEKALSPFFKSVLPSITGALMEKGTNSMALKAAIDYGLSVARGQAMVNKVSAGLFKAGSNEIFQQMYPSKKDTDKLDKKLKDFQENPQKMFDTTNDVAGSLPNHGMELSNTATRAVQYLNSQRPKVEKQSPLDSDLPPSQMQKSAYQRKLEIAEQPLIITKDIKNGTITPDDVMQVKTIFPGLYRNLAQQMQMQMVDHLSKGGTVDYRTRLGLSVFLGQALDSTMTPQAIMATQTQPPSPHQMEQDMQRSKQKHSMSSLNKLAGQFQTPQQARQSSKISQS